MKSEGILKGADRKETNWKKTKFGEPFKEALDRFREDVIGRDDFDPTALLQFGLFMSKAVINILKEAEAEFGVEGQRMVNNALVKTGYDMGKQILENIESINISLSSDILERIEKILDNKPSFPKAHDGGSECE